MNCGQVITTKPDERLPKKQYQTRTERYINHVRHLMTWQYWTVSEKRRANAERLTSCLPRLSDLSNMLVFGLHQSIQILNFNTPFVSEGPWELQNTVLVRKTEGEKETAILCD
jgi:hypothetical protein